MLALLFLLINMPLLVSTKVVSRQDLSTKLLRDWRIVSISDEVANHLDVLGLFNGIKDHKFDEHELLAFMQSVWWYVGHLSRCYTLVAVNWILNPLSFEATHPLQLQFSPE